jgi:hypothetical protein
MKKRRRGELHPKELQLKGTQKTMTMTFATLDEINKAYAAITQVDIDRAARSLTPAQPGESAIGTIHSEEARRLWATAAYFDGISHGYLNRMKFEARSKGESDEFEALAQYNSSLESICRELFWVEVKQGANAWNHPGVGVRADWMMVARSKSIISGLLEKLAEGGLG